jgi:hypothetical protein
MEDNKTENTESAQDKIVNPTDSPENMAATILYMYTPVFEAKVGKLSSNALRRVLRKLVQYPFNEKSYTPTSQEEKDVFAIADRLVEAKFLLIMAQYNEIVQKDSLTDAKESVNVSEQTNESKGDNNG